MIIYGKFTQSAGSTLDARIWRLQMWDSDFVLILIFLLAFAQHYSAIQSQKTVSAYFKL